MTRRLEMQKGEWIDRSRPIKFRFEGTTYSGFHGDVLSSALWANDVRMIGRSFKYHRPRGIYSLNNHDAAAMVEDGCRTNMRGDILPIKPGLDVRAVNTVRGLRKDWMRFIEIFSAFMPVGFYYKAFHTPRCFFPKYENLIRKASGLGRINPLNTVTPSTKEYASCDLLVVGAGPAGLSGAIAAAEQGIRVLVVDEQPHPGGSLLWQSSGMSEAKNQLSIMMEQIASLAHLEVRCATQAGGCYEDLWIALIDETRLTKLRTKAMLVATGCIEQPAVFGNNDLPGVMLGSAAQRLINLYAIKPFDRCVVLTANSEGYHLALELHKVGVEVATVVDLRPNGEPTGIGPRVTDAGISIYRGYTIYEAIPAHGMKQIKGAFICAINEHGEADRSQSIHIDCDGIVTSVGWAPTGGLLYQAGGRFTYADHVQQFVPHQLPPHVFAAGRLNGVFTLQDQIADGRRAGLTAAKSLGQFNGKITEVPPHRGAPPSHPYPIFAHGKKKNFVEMDEDLHVKDLVHAHQEGFDNIELMKRYTTVGMGPTQGKLANMNAVRILAKLNGQTINRTGTTTSRPFHQPVALRHLAGRRFHPQRRTPMHSWHEKSGAIFIHAGTWLRPEYYQVNGTNRDDCIFDEVVNVRRNTGMIDVSTLGKIEVCGPDAIDFLERMYTTRFTTQQLGKLRYGIACDETGVVIEDGIIVRLAEDRFYVTATSSGAEIFYRQMQRWAMLWQMQVILTNATGQLAAMNIAGPGSREILTALTDIDLSNEAFPYLGARHGNVAGVPAKLIRVGFVGELGYEIHVPASFGLHVWTALMQTGQQSGIRPFGVEAQRLLRLEKGHIIVNQDTDALTTPYEADMAWAIGKNKPFFVGQRSLAVLQKQPATRRLVGIMISQDYLGSLPEECHLIIEGNKIVGRVTSMTKRSTLGQPIGLAFVQPRLAIYGTTVYIRIDDGSTVEAKVVPTPFYDPKNTKQN